jgi:excinuclease ABC subunit B
VADSKPTAQNTSEENRLAADPPYSIWLLSRNWKPWLPKTRRKLENAAQDLDLLQAARYRDELAELKQSGKDGEVRVWFVLVKSNQEQN